MLPWPNPASPPRPRCRRRSRSSGRSSRQSLMAATASPEDAWIDATCVPIRSVALAVCSARFLTSAAPPQIPGRHRRAFSLERLVAGDQPAAQRGQRCIDSGFQIARAQRRRDAAIDAGVGRCVHGVKLDHRDADDPGQQAAWSAKAEDQSSADVEFERLPGPLWRSIVMPALARTITSDPVLQSNGLVPSNTDIEDNSRPLDSRYPLRGDSR